MGVISVALIGAGSRGKDVYGQYILDHPEQFKCVAVVEPDKYRREAFAESHMIPKESVYREEGSFFESGRCAELLIIASPDKDHYRQLMKAIPLGYKIMVEKPISPNPIECLEIEEAVKTHDSQIIVSHVLRYTSFFNKIKALLDEDIIGDIVHINHTENIGSFHYVHSFVRGPWHNSKDSAPIILAKSCHDMDILQWLARSKTRQIKSYGGQNYFKEDRAPKGSGEYCYDCQVAKTCTYNGMATYMENLGMWPTTMVTREKDPVKARLAIQSSPYVRCAWKVEDHDVCDHQVTLLEFDNNVKATFTMTAFSSKVYREIKIHGTRGVIEASDLDSVIRVTSFVGYEQEECCVREIHPRLVEGGHHGGDTGIMEALYKLLKNQEEDFETTISQSMESHLMAFAAELSRVEDRSIDMDIFRQDLKKEGFFKREKQDVFNIREEAYQI